MLRATLRPGRAATTQGGAQSASPPKGYLSVHIVSALQLLSRIACEHPIRTISIVAFLVSTSYISLLESNLFEPPTPASTTAGGVDFESLLVGSKTLHLGADAAWRWQNADHHSPAHTSEDAPEVAVVTLVFPDSSLHGDPVFPPNLALVPMLDNTTVRVLPPSKNILSPVSSDRTLAISVPCAVAPTFIQSIRELPASPAFSSNDYTMDGKRWMMTAIKGEAAGQQRSFVKRTLDAWTAFVDLLKHAENLDVVIMVLGYLSMWLTFVSLYMSLRRLGSHLWLATSVLVSSSLALLFGLIVTIYFGVPLNVVLLSEGLPFLVVIIGFEKPIILTRAVLSASLALKQPGSRSDAAGQLESDSQVNSSSPNIQNAIQIAVRQTGYEITRDYAIELLILVMGAALGVQGGLCQFCFLAAWILVFDYVLMFTFYTAILTVKLEINRIKRHVTLRRALEEDGVSRAVAEEVASNEDWPKLDPASAQELATLANGGRSIFGLQATDNTISRIKVTLITCFIGINLINVCTIPFRSGARSTGSALSSAVTQPPMDPFKVAGSALESLRVSAKIDESPINVVVLTPIKYELERPSVHYAVPDPESGWLFDMEFATSIIDTVTRGRFTEGILKSFEDPILGKWVIASLVLSLVLNGYLFNAARWSIKEPSTTTTTADQLPPVGKTDLGNGHAMQPRLSDATGAAALSDVPATPVGSDGDDDSEGGLVLRARKVSRRTPAECEVMLKDKKAPLLTDEELIALSLSGKIPGYALEKMLENKTRAVKIRRGMVSRTPATIGMSALLEKSKLPFEHYDYDYVHGACCENVIGYLPLPVGVAGPLTIDGKPYYLPMATTEGVLVASTSRGCKAINAGGGAVTVLTGDGMTRGPCVGFTTLTRAGEAKIWLDSEDGQKMMKTAFNSTSRFARLQSMKTALAGTYLYIRFKTTTGDAMGMNMISKGVEVALKAMATEAGFDDMAIISVSGNFCTDKKPAAINWVDGRGKSVVAEAIIPADVVRSVLKSDVDALVELNTSKNLIGSAMAGSIGGFNAHAANIVTAIFLATGQDPAQNVESSQCITIMKNLNGALQISVSMPCIEVGTIGGGTFLPPQAAMLDLLGVRGAHPTSPGDNARQLARIICAGVLAGELSLCSALAAGHLVRAHMQHNRSQAPTRTTTPTPVGGPLAMTSR